MMLDGIIRPRRRRRETRRPVALSQGASGSASAACRWHQARIGFELASEHERDLVDRGSIVASHSGLPDDQWMVGVDFGVSAARSRGKDHRWWLGPGHLADPIADIGCGPCIDG
jgi:hypothetical protein